MEPCQFLCFWLSLGCQSGYIAKLLSGALGSPGSCSKQPESCGGAPRPLQKNGFFLRRFVLLFVAVIVLHFVDFWKTRGQPRQKQKEKVRARDWSLCQKEESAAHPPPTLSSGRLEFKRNDAQHSPLSLSQRAPSGKILASTQLCSFHK